MRIYQAQPTTAYAVLATVGRAFSGFTIVAANVTGGDSSLLLHLYHRGEARGVANQIVGAQKVPANQSSIWTFAIALEEGMVFEGMQTQAGALSVLIDGVVGPIPGGSSFSSSVPLASGGSGGGLTLADVAYRHVQSIAATTWTINHSLGFQPNVAVVDSLGQEIVPAVIHTSSSIITLSFSAAVAGEAYLT